MAGKQNTEFERNPAVAMFVDILLVIGCVTVFCLTERMKSTGPAHDGELGGVGIL